MITSDAFLSIERALSVKMSEALSRVTKDIYAKVDAALVSGDLDKAKEEFSRLNIMELRDEVKDSVFFLTKLAMLFGASRVTQQPGTSVVGMGFESTAATQMVNGFLQSALQKAEEHLVAVGSNMIFPPTKKEEGGSPDGRVLHPFSSFMDSAGETFFNITSSLHTSRVSAYGFTAEAEALGLEEYQISEQLDTRTCPVCALMHGKKFKVADARSLLNIVTRSTDPDDLKQLQPWPAQTEANLKLMEEMTPAELVSNGWHTPPYHPRCRGLLTRVGKVPSLSSVADGTFQESYVSSVADFEFLGVKADKKGVSTWNKVSNVSPAEAVARLSGVPVDEFLVQMLDSKNPRKDTGIYAFSLGRVPTIKLSKLGFGSKNPLDVSVKFVPKGPVVLESLSLNAEDQGAGICKKFFRELYALSKDMGFKKMELYAGDELGGYVWAKFGFRPSPKQWSLLKTDLATKYESGLGSKLSRLNQKLFQAAIESEDPSAIYALADSSFGKDLLGGLGWHGALDLTEEEAVTRFLVYLGALK